MATPLGRRTIFQCLEECLESSDEKQSLYSKWQSSLVENSINVDTRRKNDEWFQKCFAYCEGDRRTYETDDLSLMNTEDALLYEEILQQLSLQMGQEEDAVVVWNLLTQYEAMKEHAVAGDWVQRAHRCVAEERNLIETLKKGDRGQESYEEVFVRLKQTRTSLADKLTRTEDEVGRYKQAKEDLNGWIERIQQMQQTMEAVQTNGSNGMSMTHCLVQQGHQFFQNKQEHIAERVQHIKDIIKTLKPDFDALYADLKVLTERLIVDLKLWQQHLKLKYVEVYADVNQKECFPWCAVTGKLLQNILVSDIARLHNACEDVPDIGATHWQHEYQRFHDLQTSFNQRTFIVTKQETWNVKKDSKRPIEVNLRMLAADSYSGLAGVAVHAMFIQENDINSCFNQQTGQLDLNELKRKGLNFKKGQSTKFIKQSESCIQAKFGNIELCLKLTRTKNLQVFEEKYRLVFYTQLGKEVYWTLSLPMVVTTGASQQCQCLASIMWQCYSTDVFSLPIKPVVDLPWSDVEKMLIAKMKNIAPNRSLSADNIQHLKERLLGTVQAPDTTRVTLQHFCNRPLKDLAEQATAAFTFWEWILSIYNLLGVSDILKFWKNGWIEGFLSKEVAVCKLKEHSCQKSGVFLLRFSDSKIRQSQGKDAIYGSIVPSVVIQSNGTKGVVHVMPIEFDVLKDVPLPNILVNMMHKNDKICKYLYSNTDCHIQGLFKDHLGSAPIANKDGYTGLEKSFNLCLDQLEQKILKLDLGGKRGISNAEQKEDNGQNAPETKKIKQSLSQQNSPVRENDTDTIKNTGNIFDDLLATAINSGANKSEATIKHQYSPISLTNSPETPTSVNNGTCYAHYPQDQDPTSTYCLPTVIYDSTDEAPSPSGGCVRLNKTVSQKTLVPQTCSITQADIIKGHIPVSDNSTESSVSPIEQNEQQTLTVTENGTGNQLNNISFIECPIGQSNTNIEAKSPAKNITKPRKQDCKILHAFTETSEEKMEDSTNQSYGFRKRKAETDHENGVIDMIKNYLEDMDPDVALRAIPENKLMQLLAPSLDKISPESKQLVVNDLECRIKECNSTARSVDEPVSCPSCCRHGICSDYCDLDGIKLGSPEMMAGLSTSEADIQIDFEHLECSQIETGQTDR